MAGYRVAVLGATGLVGQQVLTLLAERGFPVETLRLLASAKSAGETVVWQDQPLTVEEARPDAFEAVDLVLASAGGSVSAALVPEAVRRGAVVVDNTSFFRLQETVPLVVAGVNDEDLQTHRGIVANPNCSTAQLMPVLKALHAVGGLKRVVVSTYQSVSGAGKKGMDELAAVTRDMVAQGPDSAGWHTVFQHPIALNLIPQIDTFLPDGYTKEEFKVIAESRKILHLPALPITCTAVRVPVMIGHSESVTVDFERPVSPEAAIEALKATPCVVVCDRPEDYPTPRQAAGQDPVFVGRIRRDTSNPETGLNLWVVADNLRIGAALNAVRIAEKLHEMNLITQRQEQRV